MVGYPKSNNTVEGINAATQWLRHHPEKIAKLRYIFCRYYRKNGRIYPWRESKDPYKVLLAEFLLQKTSITPVRKVWSTLIKLYPNIERLAVADIKYLETIIRPLGLRKRAKALRQAARIIAQEAGGTIPDEREFLESLPGVGNYTASAILSFGCDVKASTIDVNAARVYTRIAGFLPKTLRQGLAFASVVGERVATQRTHREINFGVLDLAAHLCRPRPLCHNCPALKFCHYGYRHGQKGQKAVARI